MEELKYLVPIISFLLGAGFTLFLKRREKKDLLVARASEQLAELATDWYSQLYDILSASRKGDHVTADQLLATYGQNRIVLPKYIRTMEILRKYPETRKLAKLGEEFLSGLTRPAQTDSSIYCKNLSATFLTSDSLFLDNNSPTIEKRKSLVKFGDYLQRLDGIVQEINRESGKLA